MPITRYSPVNAEEVIKALNEKEEVYVGETAPTNSNIKVWIDTKSPSTTLASLVYPVGSIYMSVNNTDPSILFGGTWVSIASGRVLMGVDASHGAGTTAEAGLPNIIGTIGPSSNKYSLFNTDSSVPSSGALQAGEHNCWSSSGTSQNAVYTGKISFTASNGETKKDGVTLKSSSDYHVYGKSDTVQPPAFYVYMWRRTA